MKKAIFSLVVSAVALLTTACAKEAVEGVNAGSEVAVTFNANLRDITSRALGDGTTATQLTVLVYDKDNNFLLEKNETLDEFLHATVNLSLVKNETYSFVFWAQAADNAPFILDKTNGIVKIDYAAANNEAGDAFMFYREPITVTTTLMESIELTRPFAQINLGTSDMAAVKTLYGADAFANATTSLTIDGIYSELNLLGGTIIGDAGKVVFTDAQIPAGEFQIGSNHYNYLSVNYVLMGKDKELIPSVEFKVNGISGCAAKTISLTDVPVQRNWRTNIYGALLSIDAQFEIDTKPGFDNDHNNGMVEKTTIEDLNAAFAAGNTAAKLTEAPDADAEIILPKTANSVTIILPATDKQITFKYNDAATDDEKPAKINISAPSTENLVINAPQSTVTLNGATYNNVTATTAENTLIVSKDVTINTLTILQGNVEIYGNVENFVNNGENSKAVYHIATTERLAEFAAAVNAGTFAYDIVVLDADIDLKGEYWTPIGKSGKTFTKIFDGRNHTISNLVTGRSWLSDIGFFGVTTNGEIKNLHIHNATVKGYLDVGVVAGTPYTSKYTNIKVTGLIKVDGYAYIGGMFGKNAYANLTDITMNADTGSYVKADSEGYRTYVGGIVGFMGEGNVTVSNVVSNIDVTGSTCDVGGISGIAHYGNTFKNCKCSGNITLTNAQDEGDHLEIGGIAGVWLNQANTKVTFSGCSFTGTLKTALNGVDKSADVAETNRIVGRKYAPTSDDGELIIE